MSFGSTDCVSEIFDKVFVFLARPITSDREGFWYYQASYILLTMKSEN